MRFSYSSYTSAAVCSKKELTRSRYAAASSSWFFAREICDLIARGANRFGSIDSSSRQRRTSRTESASS